MAEFGCDHVTVPENILLQLSLLDAEKNPPPGDIEKSVDETSKRVAHLIEIDPLIGQSWDGRLPSTKVDYLANNGAILDEAIAADPITKRGLHEALEAFKVNEQHSRSAIEEVMKQF